jgi:hypothetical protein
MIKKLAQNGKINYKYFVPGDALDKERQNGGDPILLFPATSIYT